MAGTLAVGVLGVGLMVVSSPAALAVDQPVIVLTSTPNPSVFGETVTLTAPGDTCFTEGYMPVSDNGVVIGDMTYQREVQVPFFMFQTSDLAVGTHTLSVQASLSTAPVPYCGYGEIVQVVNPVPAPPPPQAPPPPPPPPPDESPSPAPDTSPTPDQSPTAAQTAQPATAARTASDPRVSPRTMLVANVASVGVVLITAVIVLGLAWREWRLRRPGDG